MHVCINIYNCVYIYTHCENVLGYVRHICVYIYTHTHMHCDMCRERVREMRNFNSAASQFDSSWVKCEKESGLISLVRLPGQHEAYEMIDKPKLVCDLMGRPWICDRTDYRSRHMVMAKIKLDLLSTDNH